MRIWDSQKGVELACFTGHTAGQLAVDFTDDNQYAVSASEDHTLRIWDISARKEFRVLRYLYILLYFNLFI